MANLIGSLRLVSTFDWSEFFESVSLVEQVLQRDPAGRLRTHGFRQPRSLPPRGRRVGRTDRRSPGARRAEERRARPAGQPNGTPDAREAHVGYYLIGGGPPAVRARHRVAAGPGAFASGARSSGTRLPAISARSPSARRRWSAAPRRMPHAHGWPWPMLPDRRAADADPGERADDPDRAAADRPPRSAAAAPSARPRAHPRVEPRTMVIVPTILDSVERGARAGGAPRSAGARQPRPAHPLRHPERLQGCRRGTAAARRGDSRPPLPTAIEALNAKHGDGGAEPLLPVPSPAAMERAGRPVDGMGAQARQDRGVQPPAARRHRHQLRPDASATRTILPQVRYCITLDSDTRLPRDAARQLIGIIDASAEPRVVRSRRSDA